MRGRWRWDEENIWSTLRIRVPISKGQLKKGISRAQKYQFFTIHSEIYSRGVLNNQKVSRKFIRIGQFRHRSHCGNKIFTNYFLFQEWFFFDYFQPNVNFITRKKCSWLLCILILKKEMISILHCISQFFAGEHINNIFYHFLKLRKHFLTTDWSIFLAQHFFEHKTAFLCLMKTILRNNAESAQHCKTNITLCI